MNKRQKEVQQSLLNEEKKILKNIKGIYGKALEDIDTKIADLMGRQDKENLQSIIYQVDYQKSLKTQINAILDTMNTEQFESISDYLTKCYDEGFIGNMYDLHGQGIPLIFPIDQEQVVEAIKMDSKINKGLYQRLGEDVTLLKKRIANNVSRGISQGSSYSEIARNIKGNSNITMNQALRIARTEGHRISQKATLDAQNKAKEKGADIVKQWDSLIDSRTRSSHQHVDGEIKELDENFSNGLSYPGDPSGKASEVVNCRCVLLQRAKWGLDDEELKALKERAEYFEIDKTESFKDFKSKYLKVSEESDIIEDNKNKVFLKIEDYPQSFLDTPAKKKQTKAFIEYINNVENADDNVKTLFKNMSKIESIESKGIPFKISYTAKDHAVEHSYRISTNEITEVKLKIPKILSENAISTVAITAHEKGHLIDLYFRTGRISKSREYTKLTEVISKNTISKSDDLNDNIKEIFNDYNNYIKTQSKEINEKYKALRDGITNDYRSSKIDYKTYDKKWKELKKSLEEEIDFVNRTYNGGGYDALQDIYDALSGGEYQSSGVVTYGHGVKYYSKSGKKESEIWANYTSLSLTRPDLIEVLKNDKPELIEALDDLCKEMVGGIN